MTHPDNHVAPFRIETQPVRGRVVRLGAPLDEILSAHEYPEAVANLLGEACVLAALVGSNFKFDGRLILQAQGDGPVSYVVADYDTTGALRGYCRYDAERVAAISGGFVRPGAASLLGEGSFVMTLDQGGDARPYQGVTSIEGETLSPCAEAYFARSEQTPTRIRLAVGREAGVWRGGGILIQAFAPDEARGETAEGWDRAKIFLDTVGEDELTDPSLSSDQLLFRLFNEDGVRRYRASDLRRFCRCSAERIHALLKSFPPEDRVDMVEPDGAIKVVCEYCATEYRVDPAALG